MKTKSLIYTICLLVLLSFTACEPWEVVRGSGAVITETRSVGTFNQIDVSSDIEVYLTQGPGQPLHVEGQDNILHVLETYVRNNKLVIQYQRGVTVRSHEPIRIYITTPQLEEIHVSGSAYVEGMTNWTVNDFDLSVSGSGKMEMTLLDADEVETDISGSGNIYLQGDCREHDIEISGSGDVHAFDLISKDANVHISGSGNCELTVQSQLEAHISGSGTVRYKGHPTVRTNISGSGKVVHAE